MSLELRDIHKHFGPVRANDGINLTVEAGTLHGLLGENGAGKSTLMKVLSGFYTPDSGEIILDGEHIRPSSPEDAIGHGIGMLHQDPLVFLPMSVIDNFLMQSPGGLRLDRRSARQEFEEVCERFQFSLDPSSSTRSLTVGERQQLEIARLLWLGARVLILDEPTTGISAPQRVKLFLATALLVMLGTGPALGGTEGPVTVVMRDMRAWISQVWSAGGARGIALGVALGATTTGLRVLLGADRPYGS